MTSTATVAAVIATPRPCRIGTPNNIAWMCVRLASAALRATLPSQCYPRPPQFSASPPRLSCYAGLPLARIKMPEPEKLERGLGLIEATSLNMTFMVGIGPFIVIPFVCAGDGRPAMPAGMGRGRACSPSSTAASGPNSAPPCRKPAEVTFSARSLRRRDAGAA